MPNICGSFIALFHFKENYHNIQRLVMDTYGKHVLLNTNYKEWFQRFNNGDFNVNYKEHKDAPKRMKVLKGQLQLLNEDLCQLLEMLW